MRFPIKKIANTRLKRTIIVVLGSILLLMALVILFISPITKYLIEKYVEKFTGRQITLNRAYVNPFTGYIHFSNIKIYEEKSDTIALSAKGISGNFDILKTLSGKYNISELTLDHPVWNIIRNKEDFNFSSLINHFAPEHPDTTNAPGSFNILNIKISDGEFHYLQQTPHVTYYIKQANFESNGQLFDADSIAFKFSFLSGPGAGSMEGNFTVNFKTLNYNYNVVVNKYDVAPIEQYLNPFLKFGTLAANIDANLKATGNFNDGQDITARGRIDINDFHFGKTHTEDYLSFDKLTLAIEELSPKKMKYLIDSVTLNHLYCKYEQYDQLDNIQVMLKEEASLDPGQFNLILEIRRYIKLLAQNFFSSYYKINRLAVYNTDLQYNNYSLNEMFAASLDPLNISADSIAKDHVRVKINFNSGLKPYGTASISLSVNPNDTGDYDMNYHFQKLSAAAFNPYFIKYTSFPLDRGTIELNGNWNVRDGILKSENHLVIIDPRITKKIKRKDDGWLPMPFIMALVREKGNVIDYEIPITGHLKSPQFHLHDAVTDLLSNIFVKPATTSYRMEVKKIENEMEKSLTFKWDLRQSTLPDDQEQFVEKIAEFLADNPEASIAIYPQEFATKEKEYILLFEARKKYYLSSKNITVMKEDDAEEIDELSLRDVSFLRYLNSHIADSTLYTLQEKCSKLLGLSLVNAKFNQLNKEREEVFLSYFKKEGVEKRIKIYAGENVIPYNGFSYYKIEYKGEIPKSLSKAYQRMNELNYKAPRRKFKDERKEGKAPIYDVKTK